MNHRHQLPLGIDLALTSEGEAFDADVFGDVAKHRFDGTEPLAVDGPAFD